MKFIIENGEMFDTFEEAQAAETELQEKENIIAELDKAYEDALKAVENYATLFGKVYGVSGKDFLQLCDMVDDAKKLSKEEQEPVDTESLAAFLSDFFN